VNLITRGDWVSSFGGHTEFPWPIAADGCIQVIYFKGAMFRDMIFISGGEEYE
jgi:hypothetical protein